MFQYRFSINFHNLNGLRSLCIFLFLFFAPISAFAATSIPFTINMSQAVNVTGTPRIAIDVGGVARYATYTSGSGTSALTFTHTMVTGDVDLDGITLTASIDLNGGTIKDLAGNDLSPLTFTAPNTANVKVNYPSLGMDFVYDADGRYTLNGTAYNDLATFLSAAGGTFTRASVGTYFDSAGVLQTAAANVPRFDYDPITNAAKGILIEESRANLLTYSKDLSTNWVNFGNGTTTVVSATETAPDGTATAVKLNCTRANAAQYTARRYNLSLTLSGQNTSSIWIKAADGANIGKTITFWQYVGPSQNITNYTLTSSWTRVTFNNSYSFSGNVAEPFNIGFLDGYGTDLNASFVVWGTQLERGAFPTSYIPTTTAAVTRAADNLTMPTGSWYNASVGTLYSLMISNNPSVAYSGPILDDTTANNTISHIHNNNAAKIYVGGTQQFSFGLSNISAVYGKTAMAYKLNDVAEIRNGTGLQTSSSSAIPTVSRLLVSGNSVMTGNIKTFKYYPYRVTNTQLQLMTQ